MEKQIDYVELPAVDIPGTRAFYEAVFEWKFEDYGPDYISFFDGRLAARSSKRRSHSPAVAGFISAIRTGMN
jgi:hypothetical protein